MAVLVPQGKHTMKGKLIVIEGSDGAGKSTQLELLRGSLKAQK